MSAAEVLKRARAAGVRLEPRGDRLAYDAPHDLSPDLLAQLRQHKAEIMAVLAAAEPANEKALETLAAPSTTGLPQEIAGGVRAILSADGAQGIPPQRWPWVQRDAARLVDGGWARQALTLGWTAADLFGCDRRAPWYRLDRCGLLLLTGGHEIVELTAEYAVLRTSTGSIMRFRRRPPARLPLALLWELLVPAQATGPPIRGPTAHPDKERTAATYLAGPRRHPDHDHLSEEDHGRINSARSAH